LTGFSLPQVPVQEARANKDWTLTRGLDVSHAVEFSKTGAAGRQQKASDSRQRPSGTEHNGRIRSLEGSPVVELQASSTPLSGGRGMVAQELLVSTKPIAARDAQPVRRTKRLFPACTTAPASRLRGTSSSSTVSPSTFTPP